MEAKALHDFNATATDELSFRKNDKLKILDMCEDKNWYRAEKKGQEGYIPTNYIEISPHKWFVKRMSRQDSENLLLEKTDCGSYIHSDGAFLLRYSESSPGDFSLSVKFEDRVQHFKVMRDAEGKYFLWVVKFDSLNDLIQYHRKNSISKTQVVFLRDMETVKRVADYDYTAQEPQELTFRRGELVQVTDRSDPNWWEGEVQREGKCYRGLFPLTYTSSYK